MTGVQTCALPIYEFLECNETCSVGGAPEYRAYLTRKGIWEKRDVQDAPWVQELPPAEWGKYANPRRANIDGRPSALAYEDTEEGWVAQRCIDFMGRCRKAGEPFFVHASLPRPHSPYVPPQCFWDLYPDDSIALPPNADYDMALKAPHLRRMARTWRENKHWITEQPDDFESARRRKLRGYLGCVSLVDHAVGQLVDWIDDHGLAENTIIVYSTDHGDYACEHGQLEKAPGICSDAITRIPMIWRWPGRVKAGLDSPAIAETVDLSQTLCALAGLDPLETSDGRDLSAILAGGSQPVREVGVTEFAWSKSIRKGQWRLVWYPREKFAGEYPDGFGELYDLDADPWEMTNRWFDPDCQAKVRELERDLMDWLVTTTRPATVLPWQRFGGWQAERRYKNCVLADGKIHFDRVRAIKEGNYI